MKDSFLTDKSKNINRYYNILFIVNFSRQQKLIVAFAKLVFIKSAVLRPIYIYVFQTVL